MGGGVLLEGNWKAMKVELCVCVCVCVRVCM